MKIHTDFAQLRALEALAVVVRNSGRVPDNNDERI